MLFARETHAARLSEDMPSDGDMHDQLRSECPHRLRVGVHFGNVG